MLKLQASWLCGKYYLPCCNTVDVNLQLLYVHKDMGLLSICSLCHLPISVHEYQCDFLLQVKVGRGHARAYDYRQSVQMRTHDGHLVDAQNALDSGKVRC